MRPGKLYLRNIDFFQSRSSLELVCMPVFLSSPVCLRTALVILSWYRLGNKYTRSRPLTKTGCRFMWQWRCIMLLCFKEWLAYDRSQNRDCCIVFCDRPSSARFHWPRWGKGFTRIRPTDNKVTVHIDNSTTFMQLKTTRPQRMKFVLLFFSTSLMRMP